MIIGIYGIENRKNGKIYVGSASQGILGRFRGHRSQLKRNAHFSRHLQAAWNFYGSKAFAFKILERCTKDVIIEREQYWIDFYKASDRQFGYNSRPKAESNIGLKCSEEAKEKMAKGAQRRILRPGEKERLAEIGRNAMNDPDTRARMAAKRKGQKHTAEARAKISAAGMGRKRTPEALAKQSASLKGRKLSPEHCAKISALKKGVLLSEETKKKMSDTHKKIMEIRGSYRKSGFKASDETVAKMRESQLKRWKDNEELRQHISKKLKGRKISDEQKAKASARLKGKKMPEHHVQGVKDAWADPVKRAIRMAKIQATVAKRRLANGVS